MELLALRGPNRHNRATMPQSIPRSLKTVSRPISLGNYNRSSNSPAHCSTVWAEDDGTLWGSTWIIDGLSVMSLGSKIAWIICILAGIHGPKTACAQATGKIELQMKEEESGEELTCRVRLKGANDRELRIRGALHQSGWNLVENPMKFEGRAGEYRYEVTHGPQFARGTGGFTLDRKSEAVDIIRLPRHSDLAVEGWRGGDLLAHVKPAECAQWLVAEDLAMSAVVHELTTGDMGKEETRVVANSNAKGEKAWIDSVSYRDARPNGGLTLHHWTPGRDVPDWVPSSKLLVMAKEKATTFCEIQRLWARDVPIWLASGKVDGVQILSEHLTIEGEGAAKVSAPPEIDNAMFMGPRGPGRLVEFIYWRLLESGLRIPPTAGSGFGKTPSPLGYNRVYAMSGDPSPEAWWQSLRAGQSFVTNGPLLRASVNECLPGNVFVATDKQPIELDIDLKLTVADPVEYLDVIFNGQTLYQARLDEYAKAGGKIPPQLIKESGWLVIRVVTERDFTYRIATTAPFYFEVNGQPRISREAFQFFQAWLSRTEQSIASESEQARNAAQPFLVAAKKFWSSRLEQANVP